MISGRNHHLKIFFFLCVHVIVRACCGSQSSVRVPLQQVSLGGEQLFVEWREERVNSERIALTEPAQLLHVQAAQGTQHCHLLVQLQGRRAYLVTRCHWQQESISMVACFLP